MPSSLANSLVKCGHLDVHTSDHGMQGVRIDYALCSRGLLDRVTSCEVLGDLSSEVVRAE